MLGVCVLRTETTRILGTAVRQILEAGDDDRGDRIFEEGAQDENEIRERQQGSDRLLKFMGGKQLGHASIPRGGRIDP